MWRERLVRILLVGLAGLLSLGAVKGVAEWQEKQSAVGKKILLPTKQISKKIEDFGGKVLGRAIKILPGGEKLKEKVEQEEEVEKQENKETEAVETIETQTQEIIEVIKELPEEQLEKIKKQVFKEFCQEVCKEVLEE